MPNNSETPICYVPTKTRWLAIITGCFSAFAGMLAFGPLFLLIPSFLVIGAAIQRRSGRPGQLLMLVGVFFLNITVLPISFEIVVSELRKIGSGSQFLIGSFTLSLAAGLLVLWCDLALVVESLNSRRKSNHDPSFGNKSDWFVYILALVLTAYLSFTAVFAFHAYRRHGRLDILIIWLVVALVVFLFDVGLGVHAMGWKNNRTK